MVGGGRRERAKAGEKCSWSRGREQRDKVGSIVDTNTVRSVTKCVDIGGKYGGLARSIRIAWLGGQQSRIDSAVPTKTRNSHTFAANLALLPTSHDQIQITSLLAYLSWAHLPSSILSPSLAADDATSQPQSHPARCVIDADVQYLLGRCWELTSRLPSVATSITPPASQTGSIKSRHAHSASTSSPHNNSPPSTSHPNTNSHNSNNNTSKQPLPTPQPHQPPPPPPPPRRPSHSTCVSKHCAPISRTSTCVSSSPPSASQPSPHSSIRSMTRTATSLASGKPYHYRSSVQ